MPSVTQASQAVSLISQGIASAIVSVSKLPADGPDLGPDLLVLLDLLGQLIGLLEKHGRVYLFDVAKRVQGCPDGLPQGRNGGLQATGLHPPLFPLAQVSASFKIHFSLLQTESTSCVMVCVFNVIISLRSPARQAYRLTRSTLFSYILRCSSMSSRYCRSSTVCLLYTSDAADEEDSVDLGGRRILNEKNQKASML
eukprot:TRINITY_DN43127_c0_g1_i1.p1 TRINITY_DN43127_c0_g1~~TRINITY_DN43127_c0_g1_i1.p1  ORF type:complete len:197 (-),score=20.80 TRINITY_DN43127_c0_g1_i1:62-652(-)